MSDKFPEIHYDMFMIKRVWEGIKLGSSGGVKDPLAEFQCTGTGGNHVWTIPIWEAHMQETASIVFTRCFQ